MGGWRRWRLGVEGAVVVARFWVRGGWLSEVEGERRRFLVVGGCGCGCGAVLIVWDRGAGADFVECG